MRDKILHLVTLTFGDFDAMVDSLCERYRSSFKMALNTEELPPENVEAINAVGKSLRDHRPMLEDQVVAIFERHFTEADVDAIVAFHESAAGRRMTEVAPALQEEMATASGAWSASALTSIEPTLARLLATPPESTADAQPARTPVHHDDCPCGSVEAHESWFKSGFNGEQRAQ
jgi:hypothetical protein